MENKNLTIMFTDIKGFTQKTSQQSRSATVDLIMRHRDLLMPVFDKYHGRVVKTIGDAFLVVFESPTNAVLTGIELQDVLMEHNRDSHDGERLEVRVAINSGEVSLVDGDIYGEPVNIASRLESISEANEIYFTESTFLAMNKNEVPTAEIGYRMFKGIPDKIKIFKVLRERGADDPAVGMPDAKTGPAAQSPAQEAIPAPKAWIPDQPGASGRNERVVLPAPGVPPLPQPGCSVPPVPGVPPLPPPVRRGGEKGFGGVAFVAVFFLFMALGMKFNMTPSFVFFGLGSGFGLLAYDRICRGENPGGLMFLTAFFIVFGLGIFTGNKREGVFLSIASAFAALALTSKKRRD